MTGKPISLFSALHRWAHRQGENFTTEAFAWLLRYLLQEETEAGRRLVARLCFDRPGATDVGRGPIRIETQTITESGTPDVRIDSPEFLAFVEVKTGSALGDTQLGRYRRVLESESAGRVQRLVLLTMHGVHFDEEDSKPDRCVRWHEVADWLRSAFLTGAVGRFVVDQFVQFLEEQVMTIERVGWEYVNGVIAMQRLIQMLGRALELASIPIYRVTAGATWNGFFVGADASIWTGIEYNAPQLLIMEVDQAKANEDRFRELGRGDWNNGRPQFAIELDAEPTCFFARSKENQLSTLTDFVKRAYEDARACIVSPGHDQEEGSRSN